MEDIHVCPSLFIVYENVWPLRRTTLGYVHPGFDAFVAVDAEERHEQISAKPFAASIISDSGISTNEASVYARVQRVRDPGVFVLQVVKLGQFNP